MLDEAADRAAQVAGQGGTKPGGVGMIGNLACSHGVIEADLRVIGKVQSGEGAVGFFVEAGGDGADGVGEEIVVIGDGEGEAGFDGRKLG